MDGSVPPASHPAPVLVQLEGFPVAADQLGAPREAGLQLLGPGEAGLEGAWAVLRFTRGGEARGVDEDEEEGIELGAGMSVTIGSGTAKKTVLLLELSYGYS